MQTKQKIIIIIISVVAVAAIATGTVLILKNTVGTNKNQPISSENQNVEDIKKQAVRALKDGNSKAAKELFQKALDEYIKLKDVNGQIDMEAQIYLIEHEDKK